MKRIKLAAVIGSLLVAQGGAVTAAPVDIASGIVSAPRNISLAAVQAVASLNVSDACDGTRVRCMPINGPVSVRVTNGDSIFPTPTPGPLD